MTWHEEKRQGRPETGTRRPENLQCQSANKERAAGVQAQVYQLETQRRRSPESVLHLPQQSGQGPVVAEGFGVEPAPDLVERRRPPGQQVIEIVGEEGRIAHSRYPQERGEHNERNLAAWILQAGNQVTVKGWHAIQLRPGRSNSGDDPLAVEAHVGAHDLGACPLGQQAKGGTHNLVTNKLLPHPLVTDSFV